MQYSIVIPHLSSSSTIDMCLQFIEKNSIYPHEIVRIVDESDVYYAFNKGVFTSKCDIVVLLNDDMFVSEGWDKYIPIYSNQRTILTGYVVEPGSTAVSHKCLEYNCGTSQTTFDPNKFQQFINSLSTPDIEYESKGWYMPLVVHKKSFVSYPNINKFPLQANDVILLDQIMPTIGFSFAKINMFVYHLQRNSSNESNAWIKKCILALYPDNTTDKAIRLQYNVIDRLNNLINCKYEYLQYSSEDSSNQIINESIQVLFQQESYNYSTVLCLTANSIPMSSDSIHSIINLSLNDVITIISDNQGLIFAFCISRNTYEKLGRPIFSQQSLADSLIQTAAEHNIQINHLIGSNNFSFQKDNESFYEKCIDVLTNN